MGVCGGALIKTSSAVAHPIGIEQADRGTTQTAAVDIVGYPLFNAAGRNL